MAANPTRGRASGQGARTGVLGESRGGSAGRARSGSRVAGKRERRGQGPHAASGWARDGWGSAPGPRLRAIPQT